MKLLQNDADILYKNTQFGQQLTHEVDTLKGIFQLKFIDLVILLFFIY